MTIIESERIILRDLVDQDIEIFYNYRSDDDLLKYQDYNKFDEDIFNFKVKTDD